VGRVGRLPQNQLFASGRSLRAPKPSPRAVHNSPKVPPYSPKTPPTPSTSQPVIPCFFFFSGTRPITPQPIPLPRFRSFFRKEKAAFGSVLRSDGNSPTSCVHLVVRWRPATFEFDFLIASQSFPSSISSHQKPATSNLTTLQNRIHRPLKTGASSSGVGHCDTSNFNKAS